jgi:hypothetical protein
MKNLFFTFIALLAAQAVFATCTVSFTASASANVGTFTCTGYSCSSCSGQVAILSTYYYGDGTTGTGLNSSHTYSTPGTYNVCLVVKWVDSSNFSNVYCGDSVCNTVTVSSAPNNITGNISFDTATCAVSSPTYNIWLITYDPSTLTLAAVDSINSTTNSSYSFPNHLSSLAAGTYRVKAWVTNATSSPAPLPTYGLDSLHWNGADSFAYTSGISSGHDIHLQCGTPTAGPGFIGGNVTMGANKSTKATGGVPDPNVEILISNAAGPIAYKFTDANGNYSFSNLPVPGTYTLYPEILGFQNTPWIVTLTTSNETVNNIDFLAHTVSHYTNTTTAVENVSATENNIAVYPNPSTGLVNITSTIAAHAVISDVVGRKVFETQINAGNTKLNLSTLGAGMYFISIKATGLNYSDKLLIQH